jgi:hypothetical protein
MTATAELGGLHPGDQAVRVMTTGRSYAGVRAELRLPGAVAVGRNDWSYFDYYLGCNGRYGVVEAGVSCADSVSTDGRVDKRGWAVFINAGHRGSIRRLVGRDLGAETIAMELRLGTSGRCVLSAAGVELTLPNVGLSRGAMKLVMALHDPSGKVQYDDAEFLASSIWLRSRYRRRDRWTTWLDSFSTFQYELSTLVWVRHFPPHTRCGAGS